MSVKIVDFVIVSKCVCASASEEECKIQINLYKKNCAPPSLPVHDGFLSSCH